MATVTKRKDSYKITVSCGYDIEGKQIRKHLTWKPEPGMTGKQIEKELVRQTVLFEERCSTGQFLDGSIRFDAFAERWFKEYAEKQLKAKTIARYKDIFKRINQAIGHIRIEKIQPHHLISFYNNLSENGIIQICKYKPKTNIKPIIKEKMKVDEFLFTSGISRSTLSSVYANKTINEETANRISSALEKSKSELFTRIETKKELSAKTILHHHRLISSIMSAAVQWQVIFSNPCERVKPPKAEQKEAPHLDDGQTAQVLDALNQQPIKYQVMIYLILYTGMRRGEACGLYWRDFNEDDKTVTIKRNLLYLPDKGLYEDTTKTLSSVRSVKLPDFIFPLLRKLKIEQNRQRVMMGDVWIDTKYLFKRDNGLAVHPDTLTSWFHDFITKNDLPYTNLKGLRHTNATLLIANGVNLATVANRLGHANTATTSKVYIHPIKSADAAATDTLQNILNPFDNQDMPRKA